ncbi:zinc ABC transporter substrate-binding protein [Paracoccus sp. MC1854]|uniref:zinc ABC transporter substrate-binding protein n=1 Tax=Paracoccus sp. MC1854 TaxID=2760306 RepID=UPI0015FFD182|nr:zinc ABC transporter substrate-binding protein [Paracoccus sp. MC1854]MBB1490538.1 zinc ABC transporter substrate-binding protein [Paracoccus sp. MC1854]
MPRSLLFAALTAVLALPAGAEPPKVVADIAAVHSLVSQVMEGVGQPDLLIPPGGSPHFYALKPSDAKKLREADIVIKIGPQLSPWMDRPLTSLAGSAQRLRLLEQPETITLPMRTGATFEPHDHGEEDHDHATGGPLDSHAWLDPENGKIWLGVIARALAGINPENAARYHANAAAGVAQIEAAVEDTRTIVAPLQDLRFIVFHDAYQYFEHRFGLTAVGAIALSDASPPGPARIAELRDRVADLGVTCALTEPQFDPDLMGTVFRGRGVKTAVVDPAGDSIPLGSGMYPELIRSVGKALAACR